jgi:iron(III) transport system permease protein
LAGTSTPYSGLGKPGFLRVRRGGWLILATVIAALLLTPLILLFTNLAADGGSFDQLSNTQLPRYAINTLTLVAGVGLSTLFLGTSLALLTSLYRFPGAKFFRIALLLPLAFPAYIAAYVYAGIFEYSGPLHLIGRSFGNNDLYANILGMPGLIAVLSLVLYPYVFATTRVAIESRYTSYLESARSLGLERNALIRKVLLPLLRPAIAGGVFLVMMEVLNDYGAMKYFGIPTFTTGIFTAWFSMGDLGSAVRLAMYLFTIVAILGLVESWYNRRNKVSESHRSRPLEKRQLRGIKAFLATSYAGGIFFVAFLAPVAYLFYLLSMADSSHALAEWPKLAGSSLLCALGGAALVLLVVIITQFVRQLVKSKYGFWIGKSIAVGYTIPGAIIAIGVMLFSRLVDNTFNQGMIVAGSFLALLFAYAVRFAGVAYQPLHAESEKQSGRLFEAGQSVGLSAKNLLVKIFLPLSRKGILLATTLVVIDIFKELPLTLILRPFNFNTLATKAFEYADDEMITRAALPALSVVIVGLIPVLLLHRILRSR